jgi:hypothetical protein
VKFIARGAQQLQKNFYKENVAEELFIISISEGASAENARKKLRGVVDLTRKNIFFVENNHFIHFQLQNNAGPYALKLHLK